MTPAHFALFVAMSVVLCGCASPCEALFTTTDANSVQHNFTFPTSVIVKPGDGWPSADERFKIWEPRLNEYLAAVADTGHCTVEPKTIRLNQGGSASSIVTCAKPMATTVDKTNVTLERKPIYRGCVPRRTT